MRYRLANIRVAFVSKCNRRESIDALAYQFYPMPRGIDMPSDICHLFSNTLHFIYYTTKHEIF